MLHPTIDELTKDKYNRYELALATAKCARLVTDEYHTLIQRLQVCRDKTHLSHP